MKKVVGVSAGQVTWRKTRPRARAIEGGGLVEAGRNALEAGQVEEPCVCPTPPQMPIRMSAGLTQRGSWSQSGPVESQPAERGIQQWHCSEIPWNHAFSHWKERAQHGETL